MEEKKYKMLKIQTVLIAILLVIVIAAAGIFSVKMVKLESSIDMVTDKIESIDVRELERAAQSLKGAADNLSDVDIDGINNLVNSLNTVSSGLEKAANAISGIFGR